MRIPRKKKKQVPNGMYCYSYEKAKYTEDGSYLGYSIKPCIFFGRTKFEDIENKPSWVDEDYLADFGKEVVGYCKLIGFEIEDQCKSCRIKL